MKNYLKWLKDELKSINTAGSIMLSFIIGVQLAFFLTSTITVLSIITLIATLMGSACTVYMMIGKPINGLLGSRILLCCNCYCHLCWGIFPGRGLVTGCRVIKNGLRKLTRRPFCWWFIRHSAKPSLTVSGTKLAGDHCCLSWWSVAFFWLS